MAGWLAAKTNTKTKTLAAKTKVQQYDHEKMHSKYGGILKQKTKANLMGHINNIFHFKNRQESDVNKVIITNYDYEGKKVKYQKHDKIDDSDTLFVFQQQN